MKYYYMLRRTELKEKNTCCRIPLYEMSKSANPQRQKVDEWLPGVDGQG